jgi:hypothetical protein
VICCGLIVYDKEERERGRVERWRVFYIGGNICELLGKGILGSWDTREG